MSDPVPPLSTPTHPKPKQPRSPKISPRLRITAHQMGFGRPEVVFGSALTAVSAEPQVKMDNRADGSRIQWTLPDDRPTLRVPLTNRIASRISVLSKPAKGSEDSPPLRPTFVRNLPKSLETGMVEMITSTLSGGLNDNSVSQVDINKGRNPRFVYIPVSAMKRNLQYFKRPDSVRSSALLCQSNLLKDVPVTDFKLGVESGWKLNLRGSARSPTPNAIHGCTPEVHGNLRKPLVGLKKKVCFSDQKEPIKPKQSTKRYFSKAPVIRLLSAD